MEKLIKSEVEIDQKEDTKTNGIVSAPVLKEQYTAAYLKNGVTRGITYQIKMLTWVAWKLMRKDDMNDWLLATEMRNARGFHDLVLKYKINNKDEATPQYMYRFVQIKLKMSKKTKISMTTLTSMQKNERQFSLLYLFKAYLGIITGKESIKPEQIKDLIIFTNRGLGESLRFLIPVKEDEIIGFEGKGKQYRIDTNMVQTEPCIMMALRQNCRSDDRIILGFLKKVVFMVDQPPEPEMEELITKEMSKVFHSPQIFYNDLYKNITEWFLIYEDGGKAPYLTKQDIIHYLTNMHKVLLGTQKGKLLFIADSSSELTDKLQRLSL
nr:PREDICTED: uncharacterized protein LOC105677659 [Linepithema humile]